MGPGSQNEDPGPINPKVIIIADCGPDLSAVRGVRLFRLNG